MWKIIHRISAIKIPNWVAAYSVMDAKVKHCENYNYTDMPHQQVECNVGSLNAGDVFILDCGMDIYVWQGPDSGRMEKHKVTIIILVCFIVFLSPLYAHRNIIIIFY